MLKLVDKSMEEDRNMLLELEKQISDRLKSVKKHQPLVEGNEDTLFLAVRNSEENLKIS